MTESSRSRQGAQRWVCRGGSHSALKLQGGTPAQNPPSRIPSPGLFKSAPPPIETPLPKALHPRPPPSEPIQNTPIRNTPIKNPPIQDPIHPEPHPPHPQPLHLTCPPPGPLPSKLSPPPKAPPPHPQLPPPSIPQLRRAAPFLPLRPGAVVPGCPAPRCVPAATAASPGRTGPLSTAGGERR